MQTEIKTLPNGLRVVFIDTKSFPTVTTILLIGAGSRYENDVNNGIAHFFEHMAFKGSKKYPDSFTIASTIEGLGGIFNAYTAKDRTGYWIKSTREHFKTVIDVISDMILHSKLEPEEIEKEKGVIREEINMYEDMPQRKVGEIFEALLYGGTPLGYDIAGTKELVTSFDRNTFTEYMAQHYFPNNAVLVVAGGLGEQKAEMMEQIEERFRDWKKGKTGSFNLYEDKQTEPALLLEYKKTEQAHFCIGYRAYSLFSPKRYQLAVLSAILGGGMSSRLFMEVREKRGLCYYVSTGRELYQDVGNIVTQAGVTIELDKIKEAIKVILQEHHKLTHTLVQSDELERAKELIKGRLLLSLEDSSQVASYFGTKLLLENNLPTIEQGIDEIDKVTSEDIQAVAKELFVPAKLNFTIIGPVKKGDITIKDLELKIND